ncbi:MAG TPA: methyltransferase [Anaerolineales bacterium]|nr:methyltransferase [Anaerolineales bacterium]
MDPELYVFPKINSAVVKVAASTTLFIVVLVTAALILPLLPGPQFWASIDQTLKVGRVSVSVANLLHLLVGYTLFIYGSYHAWKATRLKNTVEDPRHELATRILDTGYYGKVRHPMYGMFILANVGLGFAMNSVYGLGFGLLSLAAFVANGIFEEKYVMLRFFGAAYQNYMRRVTARYFTPGQAIALALVLAVYIVGLFLT